MRKTIKILAIALMSLVNVSMTMADTPQATIEAIASRDLLAVGYVDLKSVDPETCLDWAKQQKLLPSDMASQATAMTGAANEFLRQAKKAGADHVFMLVRQEDLKMSGNPLFVISVTDGHDAHETIKSLKLTPEMVLIPNFKMEVWNNVVLGGTPEQIAQAKTKPVTKRPDILDCWKKFGGHDAGLMIIGNPDTRRVVRELWPPLKAPFESISGTLIADHLIGGGLSIDLPTDLGAQVVLQATDSDSANTFCDAVRELKTLGVSSESEYSAMFSPAVIAAFAAITPEVVGNDVVLDLKAILSDRAQLSGLLEALRSSN